MTAPVLSVIIPVYNGGAYLAEALRSVRDQTFAEFECIVVNDGSTDDTARVLARIATEDNRIKIISRENRGLVASLNEAIAVSRGEFLARMDGDDVCYPERFARQIDFLKSHPEVVCVGSAVEMLDEKGRRLKTYRPPSTHAAILSELLAGNGGALIHPAVMFRRDAIEKIGGYSERFAGYGEDWNLFLRLTQIGQLYGMPEVFLGYRQHKRSYNHTRQQAQIAHLNTAIEQARIEYGVPPLKTEAGRNGDDGGSAYREWTLWALEGREFFTALRYAALDVVRAPGNYRTWSLLRYTVQEIIRNPVSPLRLKSPLSNPTNS